MNAVLKRLLSMPVLSLSAVGLMIVMVACSGSSNSNTGDGDDAGDGKTDAGDEETDGSKPGDDDDAGGGKADSGGNACGNETTQDKCGSCCDTQSGGGAAVADKALKTCTCKATCKTECGDNLCADKPSTKECADCVKQDDDCNLEAATACSGDAKCQAFIQCFAASECDDKD